MFNINDDIDFGDPSTVEGKLASDVADAIPPGWIASPVQTGRGTRYSDPKKRGDQIRIMSGNPADPDPVKQGPYVRISISGKKSAPVPLDGNPTLPRAIS